MFLVVKCYLYVTTWKKEKKRLKINVLSSLLTKN